MYKRKMEGCDQGSKHALSRNRKEKGSRKFLDNMIGTTSNSMYREYNKTRKVNCKKKNNKLTEKGKYMYRRVR